MGTCFTAGGREWDDVGREVDACFLEGQYLDKTDTRRQLMVGGPNGIDRDQRVSEIRFDGDDRSTAVA